MKFLSSIITVLVLLLILFSHYGVFAHETITVIPPYKMTNFNQDIDKIYRSPASHSAHLVTRILADSHYFIDKPYTLDALGEGVNGKIDQRPLYRTDRFDCTTFVSTVLALVESNNLAEFKRTILKIRYKQQPVSFTNRLHFICVDWNTKNTANGYLEDITDQVVDAHGKSIALTAIALIDKPSWYKKLPATTIKFLHPLKAATIARLLTTLHSYSAQVKAEPSQVRYLPLAQLFHHGIPDQQLFNQIPSGTIVEIVRPNWDLKHQIGTHLNISHMGLALRIHNQLIFREASFLDKKVEDTNLEAYLKHYLDSPTVKGIRLEKIIKTDL